MAACVRNAPRCSNPPMDAANPTPPTTFETSALLQTEQLGAAKHFGDCDNDADKRPWRRLSSYKVYCPQTKTMRQIQDVNEGAKLLFSGLVEPYEPGLDNRGCWVRDIGPIEERSFQGYGEAELIVWMSTARGHYALREPSDDYRPVYEPLRLEADLAAAAYNLLSETPTLSASPLGARLPNRLRPHFEKLQSKIARELLALEYIERENGARLTVSDLSAVRKMGGTENARKRPREEDSQPGEGGSDVTNGARDPADITVQQLVEMGYPKKRARQAVKAVRGGGVVEALDWLEAKKVETELEKIAPAPTRTMSSPKRNPSEQPPERTDVASSNAPPQQSADEEEESSPPLRVNRTKRRILDQQGGPTSGDSPPRTGNMPPGPLKRGGESGLTENPGGLIAEAQGLTAGLGETTGLSGKPFSRGLQRKQVEDAPSSYLSDARLGLGLRPGLGDLALPTGSDAHLTRRGVEECSERRFNTGLAQGLGQTRVQKQGLPRERSGFSTVFGGILRIHSNGTFSGERASENEMERCRFSTGSLGGPRGMGRTSGAGGKNGMGGRGEFDRMGGMSGMGGTGGNNAGCLGQDAAKEGNQRLGGRKNGVFTLLAESHSKGGWESAPEKGRSVIPVLGGLAEASFRDPLGSGELDAARDADRTAVSRLLTSATVADAGHVEAADLLTAGAASPCPEAALSGRKGARSRGDEYGESDGVKVPGVRGINNVDGNGDGNGTDGALTEEKGQKELVFDGLAEDRAESGGFRHRTLFVRPERPRFGASSETSNPCGLRNKETGMRPEGVGNRTDLLDGSGRNTKEQRGAGRNGSDHNRNRTERDESERNGTERTRTERNGAEPTRTERNGRAGKPTEAVPKTPALEPGRMILLPVNSAARNTPGSHNPSQPVKLPGLVTPSDNRIFPNPSQAFNPPGLATPPINRNPADSAGFVNPSPDPNPSKPPSSTNQTLTLPRLAEPQNPSSFSPSRRTDVPTSCDQSAVRTVENADTWHCEELSEPHDRRGNGLETNPQVNDSPEEDSGALFQGGENGAMARGVLRENETDRPRSDCPQITPSSEIHTEAGFQGGENGALAGGGYGPLSEAERLQEEENHPGAILSLLGGEVEILIDAFAIWWESDGRYYTAKAVRYDPETHQHLVRFFVDQEEMWLKLWREKVVTLVEGDHYSGPEDIPLYLDRNGTRPPEPERRKQIAAVPPVHRKKSRAKEPFVGGRSSAERTRAPPEPEGDPSDVDVSDDVAADVSQRPDDVTWASAVRDGPRTFHFLFENVASANRGLDGFGPDGELVEREIVWEFMQRHLWGIPPEPINSVEFSVASRNRKYVHNIPRTNRAKLHPTAPLRISEMWPNYYANIPDWDCRKSKDKLNMINTKELHPAGLNALNGALRRNEELDRKRKAVIRSYNLIFTSPTSVTNIREEEVETIMGFPEGHTRCGIPRSKIFEALGNSFQVDTIAYLLSPLVPRFRSIPGGISVLALFDGIGGLGVALRRLEIPIKRYISVEIEEHCRTVVRHWWFQNGLNQTGTLEFVEDVKLLTTPKIAEIVSKGPVDLVGGGSPCNNLTGNNRQPAGTAGGRSGLLGRDSRLFLEYPRVLNEVERFQLRLGRGNVVACEPIDSCGQS